MPNLKGKKVVFTGTLANQTRSQATKAAQACGCKVSASISKAVDYVVIGENAGQKADKAKMLGIRCLTESEWEDMLRGGSVKKAKLDKSVSKEEEEDMESHEECNEPDIGIKGKKVVFTGTFENQTRVQASKEAEARGVKVASSVSKMVDFVVVGENSGQKADKAKSLGIKCLTESEWADMISGKGKSSNRPSASKFEPGGSGSKRKCKYWEKCFRTNKDHLEMFLHPEKPQLRSTYSIEPANTHQICTFTDVPDVALTHLFRYFPMKDLVNLLKVCKRWKELIDPNDQLWRKFIPSTVGFEPPVADTAKGVVESIWRKTIMIGKERWLPNISSAFDARIAELKICSKWGFSGRDPMRAGATMFLRINPVYDFVKKGGNPKNKELLGVMKDVYEKFNRGKPYFDPEKDDYENDTDEIEPEEMEIKNEKDVMKKSTLLYYADTLTYIQSILEPQFATEQYDVEPRDLGEFSHLNEITDDRPPPYELEGSHIDSDDENTKMLQKHYKPPMLSLYKEIMEIMCGDSDSVKTRQFDLNDGCFTDSYEYSWAIIIGPYAAVYESKFYDL